MQTNITGTLTLDYKQNSFNFLRLALAMCVLVGHSFELGGFGYDPVYYFSGNIYSLGAIAVDGFFCISGILITASYQNLNSLGRFMWNRLLRILPAYWVCITITAIFLPVIFGVNIDFKYALHNSLMPAVAIVQSGIGFFMPLVLGWTPNLANVTDKIPMLGQGNMPGIFTNEAVNGSLWSLPQEFRLYWLIAILGIAGLLRKPVMVLLLLGSWLAYAYVVLRNPSWNGLANASPFRTTAHFVAGAIFYLHPIMLKHSYAVAASIIAVVALAVGCYPIVSPITTTYMMVYLAVVIPLYKFGASNDFSYGLYIYAFPVQKTLTALSLNSFGLPVYFALSTLISMTFAVASWHGIEKHALRLKKWQFKRP